MASGGANLGEGCRDFDVGKIAESARFEEEEDLSLKTAFSLLSEASYKGEEGVSLLIPLCP